MQVNEISIKYKRRVIRPDIGTVNKAELAAKVFIGLWDKDRLELSEDFGAILLDGSHQVIGYIQLARGGFNACHVDHRLLFATALKACAVSVILAHNHPSGSLVPSPEDIAMTDKCKAIGSIVGVTVLDHIIMSKSGWVSIGSRDQGMH